MSDKFNLDRRDATFAACYYILHFRYKGKLGSYPLYTEEDTKHFKVFSRRILGIDPNQCEGERNILNDVLYRSLKQFNKGNNSTQETFTMSKSFAQRIFEQNFGLRFKKFRGRRKQAAISRFLLEIRNSILKRQGMPEEDIPKEEDIMTEENVSTSTEASNIDTDTILAAKTRDEFRAATSMRFRMTKALKEQFGGDGDAAFNHYMETIRTNQKELEDLVARIRAKQQTS